MKKNIKKEKEKVTESRKNNDSPKIEKKERGKSGTISRGAQRAPFELCLRVLISTLFLIIFLLFTSLDLIHLVLGT